jgi:hypothetical protein
MYSRLRESLKSGSKGLRQSRKAGRNQKGGALFKKPTSEFLQADKFDLWTTKLREQGVPDASIGMITALFAYCSDLSGSTVEAISNAWLEANKYQDVIYRVALDLVRPPAATETVLVDQVMHPHDDFNTKCSLLIKDLTFILFFDEMNAAGDDRSKLEHMLSPATDEELSALLLFPKRIENLLVQSLASIIVMLKEGTHFTDLIANLGADKEGGDETVLETKLPRNYLRDKWFLFCNSYSTSLTNLVKSDQPCIRENFLTAHKPITPKVLRKALGFFIDGLEADLTQPITVNVPAGDNGTVYQACYLAGVYGKWFQKKTGTFEALLGSMTPIAISPDNLNDTPQLVATDVSTIPLHDKMPMQLIAFLKHLEGAVELASPSPQGKPENYSA